MCAIAMFMDDQSCSVFSDVKHFHPVTMYVFSSPSKLNCVPVVSAPTKQAGFWHDQDHM
jgi:hypothetical protein